MLSHSIYSLWLLFIFLVFHGSLSSQVGINNSNPSQSLDINGKVKIGNDNIIPESGTIRYNSSINAFEGYIGSKWVRLSATEERSFRLSSQENITISGGSFSIKANDIEFNNGDCIIALGNNNYFRAPISGRYQVNVEMKVCDANFGGFNVDLHKVNSSTGLSTFFNRHVLTLVDNASFHSFTISFVQYFKVGEYLRILLGNAGSSSDDITLCASPGKSLVISGFLIK